MILEAESHEQAARHASEWWPRDGAERLVYTVLADILVGIGTGLVLVAAYVLCSPRMNWRIGIYWGLAGFVAFSLWPAVGLIPNLPGAAVAPHLQRYVWWGVTAVMSASGLALLAFASRTGFLSAGYCIPYYAARDWRTAADRIRDLGAWLIGLSVCQRGHADESSLLALAWSAHRILRKSIPARLSVCDGSFRDGDCRPWLHSRAKVDRRQVQC